MSAKSVKGRRECAVQLQLTTNPPPRLYAPWFPKGLKLHVNDPEIGNRFSDYQKMFDEIFNGR